MNRTTRDQESGVEKVQVNLPLEIALDLVAADGSPVRQVVYATVNSVGGTGSGG